MTDPLTIADIDAIVAQTRNHWRPILGDDGARIVADAKRVRLIARKDAAEDAAITASLERQHVHHRDYENRNAR